MDPIQNQAPMANGGKKSVGLIMGVIVVIILALGAFYFWGKSPTPEVKEVSLPPVSTSDELINIDADLNAGTGVDLDVDFSGIETDL